MQNRGIMLFAGAALVAIIACGGTDETTAPIVNTKLVTFKATMNGPSEVPAITTAGTGTFTATLDTSTNLFTWDITFTGLSSNTTAGHIHGPAIATATAGTTINFVTAPAATFSLGATSGAGHGTMILNAANAVTAAINGDSLKKLLFAGASYANIHTTANGGGEIRGQIIKQ